MLAARLTAVGGRSIVLIEAGPDYPSVADLPDDIADGSGPTVSHDWNFTAEPDGTREPVALPRGRLVGGCSATNGAVWVRGWPGDYDGWAAAGNSGWTFEELLPFFRAAESDQDFRGEWHGSDGPIPVERLQPDEHRRAPAGVRRLRDPDDFTFTNNISTVVTTGNGDSGQIEQNEPIR